MTDKEIIKALGWLERLKRDTDVSGWAESIEIILNKYNRQKAEIERLEKELMKCKLEKEMLYNVGMEIKTVAIKEFAERLKENITSAIDTYYNSNGGGYYLAEDTIEDIDNLVEEMTENYNGQA